MVTNIDINKTTTIQINVLSGGPIISTEWKIDDGVVSSDGDMMTLTIVPNQLTLGTHTVSSTILNDCGNYSQRVTENLNVTDGSTPPTNLIQNGSFELDKANWSTHTDGIMSFNIITATTKYAELNVTNPGSNSQIGQSGITLKPNTAYTLKFDAKANSPVSVSVGIAKYGTGTSYGLSSSVNLATSWITYTKEFTSSNTIQQIDGYLWLFFNANNIYNFDNFKLYETGNPPLPDCIPNWQCEQPLNGYEYDTHNCGEPRRLNPICSNCPTPRCDIIATQM